MVATRRKRKAEEAAAASKTKEAEPEVAEAAVEPVVAVEAPPKKIKIEPQDDEKKEKVEEKQKEVTDSTAEVKETEVKIIEQQEADEDDDDDVKPDIKPVVAPSRACPYLDTIDRGVLDFDFEKQCSVSLSHLNVYACLVCGKYFQGRGPNTHAYMHSLDTDHRVFLNLHTLRFYCLPDNYEVIDSSLDDIKYVLRPTFTREQIEKQDTAVKLSRAYDSSTYHPGLLGLNNIKANDYCNVILHALSHVTPLRSYFLREQNYANVKRPPGDKLILLVQRFGELVRKLWNPRAFKAHVSPHEILQAVVLCSQKRFQITSQGDSIDFLSWLLNALHRGLNGTKKTTSSVIYKTFRGRMITYTRKVVPLDTEERERVRLLNTEEFQERTEETPFLYLTLDLPDAPLYRDEMGENIIPQVPMASLLAKFNGTTEKEYKTYNENFVKRFELTRLPPYLIVYIKRFTKNQWYVEKNPTIVNFPIMNVDLFDCLSEDARQEHLYTTYDLLANIVHDGKPNGGSYRIQLLHKGTNKWFELEDLHVKDILPQMITLTESYIQIWQLNTLKTRHERQGEQLDLDLMMAEATAMDVKQE